MVTLEPHQLTVLLLDDERAVRDSMRRFLELYGYRCMEANSADRVADVLRASRADAIILDVRLPGGRSGLDVLGDLRGDPEFAEVPILIMTGSILTEAEEAKITRQRAHLFYKPEGFNAIVRFLDQLTGRDRAH